MSQQNDGFEDALFEASADAVAKSQEEGASYSKALVAAA